MSRPAYLRTVSFYYADGTVDHGDFNRNWIVPDSTIRFKLEPENPMQVSSDNGETWSWTFRSIEELQQMHPSMKELNPEVNQETLDEDEEMLERELFGETLDDEIPEDIWDMVRMI